MKFFFVGPLNSSFVKNDIKILEKEHKLSFEDAAIGRGLKGMFNLALVSLRSIYKTLVSDAVFCWFADYTTLVPTLTARLFGKKVYVIAGGFDVTNLPEINCGAKLRKGRWFCVSNTFRFASKIFPVSQYASNQLTYLTEGRHAKAEILYNCIDSERFISQFEENSKRDLIVTVSQADNYIEYIRKGSDLFIKSAKENPEYKFVLAGLRGEALNLANNDAKDVDNIDIIPGPLSLYEELIPLYKRAAAYCQYSIEETFGVAVLEAMACGAMPIVSNGGALPEITKGYSEIACNQEEYKKAYKKSFSLSPAQRREFSEHARKFDISIRREKLLKLLFN